MGPPLRSFAADAHDCIMVRVFGPTGYKVVARLIAPASGLPSDRHPDRSKRAQSRKVSATTWLGSRRRNGLSDRRTKLMNEKRCAAHLKLLD